MPATGEPAEVLRDGHEGWLLRVGTLLEPVRRPPTSLY
jgi:hypothetical protein